jgi:hypothetical protein
MTISRCFELNYICKQKYKHLDFILHMITIYLNFVKTSKKNRIYFLDISKRLLIADTLRTLVSYARCQKDKWESMHNQKGISYKATLSCKLLGEHFKCHLCFLFTFGLFKSESKYNPLAEFVCYISQIS